MTRSIGVAITVTAVVTFGSPVFADEAAEDQPSLRQFLLHGATPEERTRLAEERARLSEAAAASGNDPTAIVGLYQLGYGHTAFTNGVALDLATAVVRLPVTPNLLFQVTMPYAWVDPPGAATIDGAGDMTVRAGGRLYAGEHAALFIGADASFPTASETPLGTGKYTIGPGVGLAAPLPRAHSLLYLLIQNFNSIAGESNRADIRYLQVQSAINTIWSKQWWSLVQGSWATNWENHRKTSLNLLGQIGYQFDRHWSLFAGAGAGVVDKDAFLSLDWTVQGGVRYLFRTPLIPETILGGPVGSSAGARRHIPARS